MEAIAWLPVRDFWGKQMPRPLTTYRYYCVSPLCCALAKNEFFSRQITIRVVSLVVGSLPSLIGGIISGAPLANTFFFFSFSFLYNMVVRISAQPQKTLPAPMFFWPTFSHPSFLGSSLPLSLLFGSGALHKKTTTWRDFARSSRLWTERVRRHPSVRWK